MTKLSTSSALAMLLLPIAAPAATEPPTDRPKAVQTPDLQEPDQLLPPSELLDSLLRGWTREVALQYDLDARQRERATTEVVRRWGLYFEENRQSIAPLFSQYLQMRLRPEPPDKSVVRDWAQEAAPLLGKLRNHVEHGVVAIRKILEPHQRARFERHVQAFRQGLSDVEARLGRLEKGEFHAEDFSDLFEPPGQRVRRGRDRSAGVRRRGMPKVAVDRVEVEIGAWRAFVESFTVAHRLDPGQRDTARSLLSEMCLRAGAHRDGRREEIEALERNIESFRGTKSDLVRLKDQLVRLYGPFDDMFRELENRLLMILTAEQRARAADPKPSDGDDKNAREQPRNP